MNGYAELIIDPIKCLESVSSSILVILLKWWDTHRRPWKEVDSITQCMMQMMAFKFRSLEVALEGMPLVPNGKEQTQHVDITTVAAIVRGIYEMAFIFHNIFISTDNEQEREILLNIWKIKGYVNRNEIPIPDEMKDEKLDNEERIEALKQNIRMILHGMDITDNAINKVENAIKKPSSIIKGFSFEKIDNKIIDFKQIGLSDSHGFLGNESYKGTYTFLSYQSHPSYLGVEQFGSISNRKQYDEDKIHFSLLACKCAAKFVNDACEVLTDGNKIKKEMVPDFRATINFFD